MNRQCILNKDIFNAVTEVTPLSIHKDIACRTFRRAFLLCIGGLCSMFIPNGNSLFTMKKRELPQNIIQSGQCWLLFTPNNQRRDNILLDCIEPKQLRMLFLYVR